MNCLSEYEEIK